MCFMHALTCLEYYKPVEDLRFVFVLLQDTFKVNSDSLTNSNDQTNVQYISIKCPNNC